VCLSFDVDTVSLHIHERVSTQAIIRTVRKNGEKKEPEQQDLFSPFADHGALACLASLDREGPQSISVLKSLY
jgi:hypothetical protein